MIGPIRALILRNPQNLNKVPRRLLNDEDIEYAIEKGYKVTAGTPEYLLENIKILKLYFENLNGKKISFKQLKMLYHDDKEIIKEINLNNFDIESLSDDEIIELTKMVGIYPENLINNKKFLFEYLKVNPYYFISMISYNWSSFTTEDFEKIYEIIKPNLTEIMIDTRIEYINKELLNIIANDNPKIFLDERIYNEYSISENIIDIIKELYKKRKITIEEISNIPKLINDYRIIDFLLDEDLSNISYIPSNNNYSIFQKCIDIMVSDIDKYIKYFEQIEKKFSYGSYISIDTNIIIQALIRNNIEIESSEFPFIYRNVDYIYFLFMKNPNVVFTFKKAFDNNDTVIEFSEEQIENIIKKIENEHLEVEHIPTIFLRYSSICKAYLKNNPFSVDGINLYDNLLSIDELIESGYILNRNTKYNYLEDTKIILEHLKINFDLINNINIQASINTLDEEKDLRSIFNANNYYVTKDSISFAFTPLTIIDALEYGSLTIDELIELSKYKFNLGNFSTLDILLAYISKKYPDAVKELNEYIKSNIVESTPYIKCIIKEIVNDFENVKKLDNLSDVSISDLELVYKLYLKDYENNKKYYSEEYKFVLLNPFIALYECVNNNKKIYNPLCFSVVPKVEKEFFNKCMDGSIEVYADYIKLLYSCNKELTQRLLIDNPEILYKGDIDSYSYFEPNFFSPVLKSIDLSKITGKNIYSHIPEIYHYILNKLLSEEIHLVDLINGEAFLDNMFSSFSLSKEEREKLFINCNNLEFISYIELDYLKNLILMDEKIKLAYENLLSKKLIKTPLEVMYSKVDKDITLLFDKKISGIDQQHYDKYRNILIEMYNSGQIDLSNKNVLEYIIYSEPVKIERIQNGITSVITKEGKKDNSIVEKIIKEESISNCISVLSELNDDVDESLITIFKERLNDLSTSERKSYNKSIISKLTNKKLYLNFVSIEEVYEIYYANKYFVPLNDFLEIWNNKGRNKDEIISRLEESDEIKLLEYILENDKTLLKDVIFLHQNLADYLYENFDKYFSVEDIFNYSVLSDYRIIEKYLNNKNDIVWNSFVVNSSSKIYFQFIEDETFKQKLCIISLRNDINSINYILQSKYYNPIILEELKDRNFILSDKTLKEIYLKDDVVLSIIELMLKNNFKTCVEDKEIYSLLENKIDYDTFISIAQQTNYILNENSPYSLKNNSKVVINSIKNVPLSIKYSNPGSSRLTDEEKETIKEIISTNGITYYPNVFYFMYEDFDFIFNSIKSDITNLDKIPMFNISVEEKNTIIEYVKEKIKNGEYNLSYSTPKFIFNDREILFKAYSLLPSLIDLYPELEASLMDAKELFNNQTNIGTRKNPYFIIEDILKNINDDNVTELVDGLDTAVIYPNELIDKLVEKIIDCKYKSTDKTPKILFGNNKFLMYCIDNDMYVPSGFLQLFFTLENIYNLGEKYLPEIKKVYKLGYGKKYKVLFDKYGDDSFDVIFEYGDALLLLNNLPEKENIHDDMLKHLMKEYDLEKQKKIISRIKNIDEEQLKRLINHNTDLFNSLNLELMSPKLFEYALTRGYNISSNSSKILFTNIEYILIALNKEKYEILNYIDLEILSDDKKKDILEKSLTTPNLFKICFINKYNEWQKYFELSDEVLSHSSYIEFLKTVDDYFYIQYIMGYTKELELIDFYFDEKGPKKEMFDVGLTNYNIYEYLFSDKYESLYKTYYSDNPTILKYIDFNLEYGLILSGYIISPKDILSWFDKDGFKYNSLANNLNVAYIIITEVNDWKEKVTDDELRYRLELIDEYKQIFTALNDLKTKNKVFTREFFDKLSNVDVLNGIDYAEFLSSNLSNIELLLGEINTDILKGLNLNKNTFGNLLKKLNLFDESKIDEQFQVFESLTPILRKKFITKNIFENYDKFNIFKVIKYNLRSNLLDSFLSIFESEDKIALLSGLSDILSKESGDMLGEGTRFLIKLANSINNNSKLFKDILERLNKGKDDEFIYKVLCVIYEKVEVNNIEELENIVDKKSQIPDEFSNPLEIKNVILENLVDMDYDEYQLFLERHMDLETLNKIRIKVETKLKMVYSSNPIDYEYANYLEENLRNIIMFTYLLDSLLSTISSTNDIEQLKKLVQCIKNNDILAIKKFSLNIREIVRQIYEIDAQLTLTKISDVMASVEKDEVVRVKVLKTINIDGVEYSYYDLSCYEYALYAHVNRDLFSLFNSKFEGHSQLCLSPVSDRGVKGYYSSGIIFGFDNVPNGGFIASASTNTGSNGEFDNNIEIEKSFIDTRYDQKEIKESSALQLYGLKSHSETNVTRDGMYPACIIIRGEEPTLEEIEAAKQLATYLGLPEGSLAPLVKLQPQNTRLPESELEHFEFSIYTHMDDSRTLSDIHSLLEQNPLDYRSELDRLKKLKVALETYRRAYTQLENEKITYLRRVKLRTGASHDIYKCKIDENDYYVKPALDEGRDAPHRAYAVKLGYDMQQLINPNNSVNVELTDIELDGKMTLCSLLEEKKNTHDFDIVDNSNGSTFPKLSDTQIESILRELIVDHLLFNYDTKGVNFLYDEKCVYGIDKEQAVKFCNKTSTDEKSNFAGEGINPIRQSGNGVAFYNVFIQHYKDKISKEKIIEIYTDVLKKVESKSLKEFIGLYLPYLKSLNDSDDITNEKIQFIIGRRIRLVSETIDFVRNKFGIELNYTEKDLNGEIEELNEFLESNNLERVGIDCGKSK